jgi:hypothetical protein
MYSNVWFACRVEGRASSGRNSLRYLLCAPNPHVDEILHLAPRRGSPASIIYLAYVRLSVLTANITLAWPQSSVLLTTRDDINSGKHTSARTLKMGQSCNNG